MSTTSLVPSELEAALDFDSIGRDLHGLAEELFPICRSITGDGFRESLGLLRRRVPLIVHEVPTGTHVFDWVVPREWNITEAYITDSSGRRVVDFADSNLHVVNYSVPIRTRMPLSELRQRLHTLADHPDWIPYRTSYYHDDWGFCLTQHQLVALEPGEYEVVIGSSLEDGSLTYGELVLPGASDEEVLISCHACHPSLANDNLSGVVVATALAETIKRLTRRYTYRFLFIPGTIGSITWLARNRERLGAIKAGLVLTCLGDPGSSTYKRSRRGDAEIDRAMEHILATSGAAYEIVDFTPLGYDERQYCSPAFDLPVGCLMRTPHGRFPEYHSSADDLSLVQPWALADSFRKSLQALLVLEGNAVYRNLNPECEPQLGRRGLYRAMGGDATSVDEAAVLWTLNLSDGRHDLLAIAQRSKLGFAHVRRAADLLLTHGLLEAMPGSASIIS